MMKIEGNLYLILFSAATIVVDQPTKLKLLHLTAPKDLDHFQQLTETLLVVMDHMAVLELATESHRSILVASCWEH